MKLIDAHTHKLPVDGESSIVSGTPAEVERWLADGVKGSFSVGIHPWTTVDGQSFQHQLDKVESLAMQPQVVAIGEAGIDTLRGASVEMQTSLLKAQVRISERVGKPLVLHVVRSGHLIASVCRDMERELHGLRQPWIWHGFRGGPSEAQQFLRLRTLNYISIGSKFNASTVALLPADRMLLETDEADLSVCEVARRVAEVRAVEVGQLIGQVECNQRAAAITV